MPDRPGVEQPAQTPWYFDANGNCPPWFDFRGGFVPDKFDPGAEYIPRGNTYELPANPGRRIENPFDLRNLRVI